MALSGGALRARAFGSQVPAAWLVSKLGSRRVLGSALGLGAVAALLCPTAVTPAPNGAPLWVFVAARVLVGCSQGAVFPCAHTELARWRESFAQGTFSTVVSVATSGMYLGSAVSFYLMPAVAARSVDLVFQLQGALGLLWVAVWMWLSLQPGAEPVGGAGPNPSPRAQEEGQAKSAAHGSTQIPWGALFRSKAVWAIITNNFAFHFVLYATMNWMPTYFESALRVSLVHMGFAKIVPYLSLFIFSNLSGMAGDHLISRLRWDVAAARKAINSVGFIGVVVTLLAAPIVVSGELSGVVAMSSLLAFCAISRGGFAVNHMDIAPRYAGAVMSVANTAGTVAGTIAVQLTGVILDATGGDGWGAVFATWASVCVVAGIVFAAWAKGEPLLH